MHALTTQNPFYKIITVPTLFDNYSYLIIDQTGQTAIVDCPDADPILQIIEKEHLTPIAILNTHHHADHVAGNEDLLSYQKMPVYGGGKDQARIPGMTHPLRENDVIRFGSLTLRVLDIPGHTHGHIAYYLMNQAVFTGDTLFSAGCGRLFEGTAEQLFQSLSKLVNLPDKTEVYCGHEYTEKNLDFALTLEPKNEALQKKRVEAADLREQGRPTLPSTIGDEKKFNPFLRVASPEIIQNLEKKMGPLPADSMRIFAVMRELRNHY